MDRSGVDPHGAGFLSARSRALNPSKLPIFAPPIAVPHFTRACLDKPRLCSAGGVLRKNKEPASGALPRESGGLASATTPVSVHPPVLPAVAHPGKASGAAFGRSYRQRTAAAAAVSAPEAATRARPKAPKAPLVSSPAASPSVAEPGGGVGGLGRG